MADILEIVNFEYYYKNDDPHCMMCPRVMTEWLFHQYNVIPYVSSGSFSDCKRRGSLFQSMKIEVGDCFSSQFNTYTVLSISEKTNKIKVIANNNGEIFDFKFELVAKLILESILSSHAIADCISTYHSQSIDEWIDKAAALFHLDIHGKLKDFIRQNAAEVSSSIAHPVIANALVKESMT